MELGYARCCLVSKAGRDEAMAASDSTCQMEKAADGKENETSRFN
jgi:hypothetical protein